MSGKVLIIGGGGREHALGYGLSASPHVEKLYFAPGNGGTSLLAKSMNISVPLAEIPAYVAQEKIDFVVIGPEAPLIDGLSDALRAQGTPVFGASKIAAQLEGSKAFATNFMQAHDISLPPSFIAKNFDDAIKAVADFGGPAQAVIKADGLAGGKGVFLPDDEPEARTALKRIFAGYVDKSGEQVVIQKRYHGPEVSIFALSDGKNVKLIPIPCQDHKRLLEGDKGPNTGGMGVYAPLPDSMISPAQWTAIHDIAEQTIAGMANDSTPYEGVLYIGLMLAEELDGEPVVIEYNARFGDPETEVLVPLLLKNGVDIYEMLYATATGGLPALTLPTKIKGAAITYCLAADGYPDKPISGEVIYGLEGTYTDVLVFHGGTATQNSDVISSGGRVLYVTGYGADLETAANATLQTIGNAGIHFAGMQYRTDIGHQAFKR
jgi:phosphoribosylamine--glycine ligase